MCGAGLGWCRAGSWGGVPIRLGRSSAGAGSGVAASGRSGGLRGGTERSSPLRAAGATWCAVRPREGGRRGVRGGGAPLGVGQEQAAPLSVKPVGAAYAPEVVPWKPNDWEPPAGIVPL